jgi:hypothetical protein
MIKVSLEGLTKRKKDKYTGGGRYKKERNNGMA